MSPGRSGADSRRLLHRYRRMILLGRASLPLEVALRLMGPDCAYHLYFRHRSPRADRVARSSRRRRRRGARRR